MMHPLRSLFAWLSHRRAIGDRLEQLPGARRLIRRFVAGIERDAAVTTAHTLIDRGFRSSFSFLGEDVLSREEATEAAAEYERLLTTLQGSEFSNAVTIAVKPSLLGLAIDPALAEAHLLRIVDAAQQASARVELDMERAATVDSTLHLYRAVRAARPDLGTRFGIALQAYLRRTETDLAALIADGIATVRLVKGAYGEPESVAYTTSKATTNAFHRLIRMTLEPTSIAAGSYLAIGTHDPALIAAMRSRVFQQRIPADRWEVQMLYGVRTSLQDRMLREGYPVRVYLPYGRHWYAYLMRRLAERPATLWFLARQMFRP